MRINHPKDIFLRSREVFEFMPARFFMTTPLDKAQQPRREWCNTCEHHTENQYMDFCKGFPMSSDDPTEIVTFIKYHGCASHSNARPHTPTPEQCQDYPCGMTMGVGDGDGNLFIHGSWEAINRVRENEKQAAQAATLAMLDKIANPVIRMSEKAESEGDYVSQTCFEDVLKVIATLRDVCPDCRCNSDTCDAKIEDCRIESLRAAGEQDHG
jgi:hypothetical protein